MNYDAYLKTDGVGRNVLEARIRDMVRELKTLHEKLTSTQTRCTELLEELSAERGVNILFDEAKRYPEGFVVGELELPETD